MNFLGHAVFADGPDDVLFGSVAGDLIGISKVELPDSIRAGTVLHADLDTFFDGMPQLTDSRKRLYGLVRHYQNPVLDICSDHVLASRWGQLFNEGLSGFASEIYQALAERERFLTPTGREMVGRLIQENWLEGYGTTAGLQEALTRISHRVRNGQLIRDRLSDVLDTVPVIEEELMQALPVTRIHMEDKMTQLGIRQEGRVHWKEGASFTESRGGSTERQ